MSVITIDRTDPRLGRHVNHDDRSRMFPYRARSNQGDIPVDVHHARHVPIWDQGEVGSCTGNAGLGCLATGRFWEQTESLWGDWTESGAVSIYSAATTIDPYPGSYPGQDTGSDGLSVAKVLTTENLISGYVHAFSLEDVLNALQSAPLIVGTRWYESMFNPHPDTGEVDIDRDSSVAGGHEYILDQYRAEDGMIGATNSWGTAWGREGRFYLHVSTLRRLLGEEGDATIFTPASVPAPVPIADPDLALFASKINRWRHSHYPAYGASRAQRAADAYLISQGL